MNLYQACRGLTNRFEDSHDIVILNRLPHVTRDVPILIVHKASDTDPCAAPDRAVVISDGHVNIPPTGISVDSRTGPVGAIVGVSIIEDVVAAIGQADSDICQVSLSVLIHLQTLDLSHGVVVARDSEGVLYLYRDG